MAHNLVTLLGGGTRDSLALNDLRVMTRDGVDVRLIADILAKAHLVMRRLGLDPADTTPAEVYNALTNAVRTEQWLSLLDGAEFVLIDIDGEIISFNPVDVVNNFHFELPLENRQTSAAKKGLGWEITRRYSEHSATSDSQVKAVAHRASWPTEEPQFCRIAFGKPSILTIGDIATEALITMSHDDAEVSGGRNSRKISFDLGARVACKSSEVQDAVGGAANAAVAFAKLGVQPSLMSWLGSDTVGRQSLRYLQSHGVDMSGVLVQRNARTNYHYVLRHGAERTIIANYESFDYRWREPVCSPDWVYLSMISGDSWEVHEGLSRYLADNPSVKLAFQPGAPHFSWGVKKLSELYRRSDIVIMNIDEAMIVSGRSSRSVAPLLRAIHAFGPRRVVLTDGPKGAYAYDGKAILEVPSYPDPAKPVDRTGAGDSFAATLVAELAKGEDIETALLRAPINSMGVVQQVGAQSGLLSSSEINNYLDKAPDSYRITTL